MAFDAYMMRASLNEFSTQFPEAKIEKVLQPKNDEVNLLVHYGRNSRRLVFNAGPNAPRLQLSDIARENPQKPPMLCMLLRKYFTGARITSVSQPGLDRIAKFTVSCYDEMGFPTEKNIICEIMGKYANLIVTDGEMKVLTALKIIDFASSTVRQVLPGLKYQVPKGQDKLSVLDTDEATFINRLSDFPADRSGEKFITSTFGGIATQIAHELVYRASGGIDTPLCEIDPRRFWQVFSEWQALLAEHRYTPTVAIDKSGKPIDYSYMDITYLRGGADIRHFERISDMFDMYFAEKDRQERIHVRAHDIVTLLNNATARTERKLAIQRQTLLDSERAEEYKRQGDLITSNLYRLKRGMTSFLAVDYYDESCPEIEISLDSRLSPSQNAQRAYKQYNKCKNAKEVLTQQIAIWERELVYLESVKSFLQSAVSEEDLNEIRDELYRSGYASGLRDYRPAKQIKARPTRFVTSGGYELLVGRNNIQNDQVTFKLAGKDDIWFHTKGIPGSHVVMLSGADEPSERDYTEAAAVAALFSSATGDIVAVDYTRVKNIKKPQGSKPGFVTYKTNYTAYVKPAKKEDLVTNG